MFILFIIQRLCWFQELDSRFAAQKTEKSLYSHRIYIVIIILTSQMHL